MLAAVVENSNDFISLFTPDGEVMYVNEAGREMVGEQTGQEIAAALCSSLAIDRSLRFGCPKNRNAYVF